MYFELLIGFVVYSPLVMNIESIASLSESESNSEYQLWLSSPFRPLQIICDNSYLGEKDRDVGR